MMLHDEPALFENPIKKNNMPLFRNKSTKRGSIRQSQEKKDQQHLISQLYVSTLVRGGDMHQFFSHETLAHPLCLSKFCQLHSGDKAEILPQLKNMISDTEPVVNMPAVDAAVLEGSVLSTKSSQIRTKDLANMQKKHFSPTLQGTKKY